MHLQNLTHVLTSVVLFCAQFIQLDQVTASSLEQTYTSWQLDASFGTNGIVEFDGDSTPPSYNFLNYRTFPKSNGGINVLACLDEQLFRIVRVVPQAWVVPRVVLARHGRGWLLHQPRVPHLRLARPL